MLDELSKRVYGTIIDSLDPRSINKLISFANQCTNSWYQMYGIQKILDFKM